VTTAPKTIVAPGLCNVRRRSLAALLTGEGVSYAGSSIHAVALPALAVLHLHATPGQAALLAFAAEIPVLVVALPAGVILDRYPLRNVLVSTDVAAAAVVAVIPAAAILDVLAMPLLYGVALALGVLSALHVAAAMAAVPLLADLEHLHRANSRFSAVLTTANSAGTALGTVLVAVAGPARAIGVDALSFLGSAWCATRIRALPAPTRTRGKRPPMLNEIRDGFIFVSHDPVIRPLFLALTAVGIGCGLTTTLLSYHLLTAVAVGTTGLGVIMAASSLGGLVGALTAPRLARRYGPGIVIAAGFLVYALMQIAPVLARPGHSWLAVLAGASFVQWAAGTCIGTTQRSVQQRSSPPHLHARVQQISLWLATGSQPLAALAAGALGPLTRVRSGMLAGVLVRLVSAWTVWRSPVRRLASLPVAAPLLPATDRRSRQTPPARPVPAAAEGARGGAR
jgi:MFS family permease